MLLKTKIMLGATLGGVLAAGLFGYTWASRTCKLTAETQQRQAVERALAQSHFLHREDLRLMEDYYGFQLKSKEIFSEMAARPIESSCDDLGSDFLRLFNDAAAQVNRADSAQATGGSR